MDHESGLATDCSIRIGCALKKATPDTNGFRTLGYWLYGTSETELGSQYQNWDQYGVPLEQIRW
jgi:hypothetical protein